MLDIVIDLFFLFDIIANCLTGFNNNNLINYNIKKIILRYLKSTLIFDIVTSLPFSILMACFYNIPLFNLKTCFQLYLATYFIKLCRIYELLGYISVSKILKDANEKLESIIKSKEKFNKNEIRIESYKRALLLLFFF